MFDRVLNTPLNKVIRCSVPWKGTLANNLRDLYSHIKTLSLSNSTWFSCLLLIRTTMFWYFPVLSRVSSLKNLKYESRWKCWQWFDINFVLQQIIACSKLIMKSRVNIPYMFTVNYNGTRATSTNGALVFLLSILINHAPNLQLLNTLLERILLKNVLKVW